MTESSSDDFSDIDYTQNKHGNVESFEDFSPSSGTKIAATIGQGSSSVSQSQSVEESEPSNSFGYDEFDGDQDDTEIAHSKKSEISNSRAKPTASTNSNIGNDSHRMQSDLYYNPREYDHLEVNNEIRRLFEYIERFKYNEIELETHLKPFIPDYIPSIGNVDSFLKPTVSTTDYEKAEQSEKLGVCYLDEPILNQSDPSTFYLKLSNESKRVSMNKHAKISSIADAERNTNKIRNWIDNFKKIKNKSLSHNVHIDSLNNMPKVEELMQPFINEQFNEHIRSQQEAGKDVVPSYHIDLTLEQYAKIICNVLDIPVQNDDINTSLHLLFTTYAALQSTS